MRKLVLAAVFVLMAGGAQAASYQLTNGNVVDPIQISGGFGGGNHNYSGPNLEPGVVAPGARLHGAILNYADLTNANLSGADLGNSYLTGANLTGANLSSMTAYTNILSIILTNANLTNANLTGTNWTSHGDMDGANFSGANFSGATWLIFCCGTPYYDALTNFTGAWADNGTVPFDPVAAGWALIPEPNTALLVGIGLAGIAARRRPATAR